MTLAEAKKILHPDTSREALIIYSRERGIAVVEEACRVACEAIEKLEVLKEWIDSHAKNDIQ